MSVGDLERVVLSRPCQTLRRFLNVETRAMLSLRSPTTREEGSLTVVVGNRGLIVGVMRRRTLRYKVLGGESMDEHGSVWIGRPGVELIRRETVNYRLPHSSLRVPRADVHGRAPDRH